MNREDIQKHFFIYKPEIEIYTYGRFAIRCEIDIFNNHIIYFIREYQALANLDYGFCSSYEDVITYFLEKINKEEKSNETN